MAVSGVKVVEEGRRIRSRKVTASTTATRVDAPKKRKASESARKIQSKTN